MEFTIRKLPEICEIKTGKRDANHATKNGKYRFYTCANQYSFCDTFSFNGKSVIVPGNGDIGLVFYYDGEFEAYQRTYVLQNININAKYLYYHLLYKWRYVNTDKQFGSTVRYVRMSNFTSYTLPVPSLPEQEKIVAKIEELFSELDNGVETLKKTKQQLAVYRQAVLKEAFENCKTLSPIRDMSTLVTSGSRGWAQFYASEGAKFIRIGNLTRDSIDIDFSDTQYVNLPDKAEGLRSKLQPNDVLVSITADLGSIGLVPNNIGEAYINQHIAVVRFKNASQGKFMAWYLRSDWGQKDLLKNKRGAGKLGLGLDDIRDSRVPVVSDEEAEAVLDIIESRLSVCDSIEETVDTALQQAEAMRQSILKKAFEGKL